MIPGLVAVGIGLLGVVVLLAFQWRLPKDSLSVMVEDRTEDDLDRLLAERPVATIDDALAQTTDPAQRDALLDVRLRAMGGAE